MITSGPLPRPAAHAHDFSRAAGRLSTMGTTKSLKSLNARFVGAGGPGVYNADGTPARKRYGVGVIMTCPCGRCDEYHQLFVPFENPLDRGPAIESACDKWRRRGSIIERLVLSPSVLRNPTKGGCGWHGYIGGSDGSMPGHAVEC